MSAKEKRHSVVRDRGVDLGRILTGSHFYRAGIV